MTQFKVGDVVQVATMDYLAGELENWAKSDGLKMGVDYVVRGCTETSAMVMGKKFYHRNKRFKLKTNTMELKVTKEKVLEAASKCSQAKETLKTLFPEAFEDGKERFYFGDAINIDTKSYLPIPFFIGQHFAPIHLEEKCLIVGSGWDVEVFEHDGYKIIAPFKK